MIVPHQHSTKHACHSRWCFIAGIATTIIFLIKILSVYDCMCACTCTMVHVWREVRGQLYGSFSPTPMGILGLDLRSSDLQPDCLGLLSHLHRPSPQLFISGGSAFL